MRNGNIEAGVSAGRKFQNNGQMRYLQSKADEKRINRTKAGTEMCRKTEIIQ
jgi:hypothetical protein